jgi:hypothetical protein
VRNTFSRKTGGARKGRRKAAFRAGGIRDEGLGVSFFVHAGAFLRDAHDIVCESGTAEVFVQRRQREIFPQSEFEICSVVNGKVVALC